MDLKRSLYLLIGLMVLLTSCYSTPSNTDNDSNISDIQSVWSETDTAKEISAETVLITPLDFSGSTEITPSEKKQYTIMIYLNGSDLESENGYATDDINEILESGFDEENINVLIMTGGTQSWQNDFIPSDTCVIYKAENSDLTEIADVGKLEICSPEVLSGFLNFGYDYFPAEKYGLILWNHGAGAVYGFGYDEYYPEDSMYLFDLDSAMASSKFTEKIEFIGFDACLMANLETAYICSRYANYLIGSEELEPGYGWNYLFLADINATSLPCGKIIGTGIAERYVEFYKENIPDEQVTISVIDLGRVAPVAKAFEDLALAADNHLNAGGYNTIAKSRGKTKSFGYLGYRGGSYDMIDISHFAEVLSNQFPKETSALKKAVSEAVVKVENMNVENANGISAYFPFEDKESLPDSLDIYKENGVLTKYTGLISDFSEILTGETMHQLNASTIAPVQNDSGNYVIKLTPEELENVREIYFTVWEKEENIAEGINYYIQLGESTDVSIDEDGTITTDFDGYWTELNGHQVCLYELDSNKFGTRYAIPAMLNGKDVNIIALYNKQYPNGKILGAIPQADENTNAAPKDFIDIKDGDKIQLYYYAELFYDKDVELDDTEDWEYETWYDGEEWTVKGELKLDVFSVDSNEYLYGFTIVDLQNNTYFTDFVSVEYYDDYYYE